MRIKKINYLFSLLLILGLWSCQSKVTNTALKKGDKLKSAINDFEDNRVKLSSSMIAGIEEAQKSLTTEEDPNVPEIAKDWEKEWGDVQSRYNKLKSDFENVGKRSDQYFQQLDELSGSINNEQLRNDELQKNEDLKKRWQVTYDKAKVSVDKITEVLNSGNDFHMVLVASSIRLKIEQNVAELNNISEQAKLLLKDLEAFTEAGRELVEG